MAAPFFASKSAIVPKIVPALVVERIVADIDEIVRLARFPGWQNTKPENVRFKKPCAK